MSFNGGRGTLIHWLTLRVTRCGVAGDAGLERSLAQCVGRRVASIHTHLQCVLTPKVYNELYRHDGRFFDTPVWWAKRDLKQWLEGWPP